MQSPLIGQVAFHDNSKARYFTVEQKQNDVVNRITKTKVKKETDIILQMEAKYNKEQQQAEKAVKQQQAEQLKQTIEEQKKKAEVQSYSSVMQEENMTSNSDLASTGKTLKQLEDDFMWSLFTQTKYVFCLLLVQQNLFLSFRCLLARPWLSWCVCVCVLFVWCVVCVCDGAVAYVLWYIANLISLRNPNQKRCVKGKIGRGFWKKKKKKKFVEGT